MKKAMKIMLPLLLVIAILGCLVWYLFVYDRTFTRDVLLYQARTFETKGKHDTASWFYDLAYAYANQDEDVAIELANQYKASGNYTKAEYTLSRAIADGGSAKLYTALCKTYVEQDKLLDAVNMLDSITDPVIKTELNALRPAAPAASPEPGFYNQYVDVVITCESGTLYSSVNNQYPSLLKDVYTAPITLTDGVTTIYAVAVDDNGLVSPVSIFGYTVGGVVEEVSFTDPAVEARLREMLTVSENKVIYTNELWTITAFVMPEDAQSYEDLKYLPYLQSLHIENAISDELDHVGTLTHLQSLYVTNCRPNEEVMSTIAALPELTHLTLVECGLSTIESLSPAVNLTYLDLSGNSIRNISVLSSMAGLEELHMRSNALTDLSALSGLNSLKKLDVSYNSLASIAPIYSLQSLNWLDAGNNLLSSLGAINNLTGLTHLSVDHNYLTDVLPLANCTVLTELNISNNTIADISALVTLTELTYFDFSYNQVEALPAWEGNVQLITIDGSYNLLKDLDALAEMPRLNNVFMDYNQELESVEPLASCPKLTQVNVFGTKVLDVSSLTRQGIIVNFDPTAIYGDLYEESEE